MQLPEEFIKSMKELLGTEYEAYLESYKKPKVQGLRVNTNKISVADFLKITPFGLIPIPWTENGFYYKIEEGVTKHPHYYAGLYYIQEPSAMIPASRLPIKEHDRVLDLCAAPGGKATELGARLRDSGILVANDISNSRARGLLKNLELFGIGKMLVTSEEPEKLLHYFEGFFDKILIDAPCSGEGMFRKEPAMVKNWEQQGPAYYAKIQKQIIHTAIKMLKPGGKLLYSTCTFSPVENEAIIAELLERNSEMKLIPMEEHTGFSPGYLKNCVRIWPHKVDGEGHFAALLQKNDTAAFHQETNARISVNTEIPKEALDFLNQLSFIKGQKSRIERWEDRLYLLPTDLPGVKGLRFLRTGLYLGDCKKNRFEPSQALAMYLKMTDYPSCISLPWTDARIIRYLKGESIELKAGEESGLKSWTLVCVDGYPLGFAKLVNGTLRNKYYPGWRMK